MGKISVSIDLSKVNKEWFYVGTNGKKYLQIDIYENDVPDKFNNTHAVKQAAPKDVREAMKAAGEKTPYIGNGKEWGREERTTAPRKGPTEAQLANLTPPAGGAESDEVPF